MDDEPLALDYCIRALSADGFSVTGAASAEDALGIMEQTPAFVLSFDLNLPAGMNGVELCR